MYNQAILKSPESGKVGNAVIFFQNTKVVSDQTLPLALFKRAKLLVSLNEFSSALTDTQISLKLKIPNNYKFEIFSIMAICYKALNNESKAQISLNLAEKLTIDSKLLQTLQHKMSLSYNPKERPEKTLPPITGDHHSQFSHASKKITVKKSPELGRFVVGSTDIKTGETLVVEPAVVACLNPEKFGTHCQHCFSR